MDQLNPLETLVDELAMAPKAYNSVTIDDVLVDALNLKGISFLQSSMLFDKQGLMKCHAEAAAEFKIMVGDPRWAKRTFSHHVLDPWRPSARFDCLNMIVLADLRPPNASEDPHGIPVSVHHGHYVLGRWCVKAFLTGGVRTMFEDREGRAILVVIDNAVCTTTSEAEVCKMYPEGMEVAIKEPAYTQLWKDGTLGFIIADSADVLPIADIILCDNARAIYGKQRPAGWRLGLKYIEELCGRAEKHLADGQCTRALTCYNVCADLMEKIAPDSKRWFYDSGKGDEYFQQEQVNAGIFEHIYSKRYETYQRLGMYKYALQDAMILSQLNPSSVEHQMRRAICLHGLHRYHDEAICLGHAQLLASLGTSNSDQAVLLQEISDQKSRASIGMSQSDKGIYEFDDNEFTKLFGTESAHLGCAPFVGSIELRTNRESGTACEIGGREPLMVASKDVKQGELLLVTNPLARGEAPQTWPQIRFYNRRPPRTSDEPDITSWSAQFQNTLVQALAKAQLSSQYFVQLTSMMRGRRMHVVQPSLNLFTEVGDDDTYGYVRSWEEHQLHLERVDIRDIRCVLASNGFGDGALYGLPFFFKHSCAPNCVYYTNSSMQSGGAMLIAATRNIPAGEELSIYYVSLFHSIFRRSEQLARRRGKDFCSCLRCTFEDQALTDIPELRQVLYRYNSDIEAWNDPFRVYDKHEVASRVEPVLLGNPDSEGHYDPNFRVQHRINKAIKVETDDNVKDSVQDVLNIEGCENMLIACLEVKERVEEILGDDSAHVQLSEQQKDWIRCSFALAYVYPVLFCPGNVKANFIDVIVQFLTSVQPGTSNALTILALCIHKVERSGANQILQKRFKDMNLYLPFKETSYENLLNWGHAHFNRFLFDITLH